MESGSLIGQSNNCLSLSLILSSTFDERSSFRALIELTASFLDVYVLTELVKAYGKSAYPFSVEQSSLIGKKFLSLSLSHCQNMVSEIYII